MIDPITLGAAKKYTDSRFDDLHGQKVYLSIRSSDAPNMVVNGITLEHRSDLMPTKQDLDNAKIRWLVLDDKGEINISGEYHPTISTMHDSDVLYGGIVGDGSVFLVVAYKSGDQTISFNGEDIAINIPKTGMYISVADDSLVGSIYGIYVEWVDIVPINELLIPTLSGINLHSSSGDKVFRVTVDDTGAITATEVTT